MYVCARAQFARFASANASAAINYGELWVASVRAFLRCFVLRWLLLGAGGGGGQEKSIKCLGAKVGIFLVWKEKKKKRG